MAILAAALTFGAFVTVTQVSNAGERRRSNRPPVAVPCPPTAAPTSAGGAQQAGSGQQAAPTNTKPGDPLPPTPTETDGPGDTPQPGQNAGSVDGGVQNGRQVRNYPNDQGDENNGVQNRRRGNRPPCIPASGGTSSGPTSPSGSASSNPGREGNLGTNCEDSELAGHDGFQNGDRCVSVSHGEVPAQEKGPTLLITAAPRWSPANQGFVIRVSTRNLVRDRFLAAGTGGYYAEASFLTADGLVRGHLHTSCRRLASLTEAPDPTPVPAFFVATEDGGGGAQPDTLTISVPGLADGIYQCSVWAGDGGHRTPMMQRANQQPAFDSVRVMVGNPRR